MSKNKQIDEKSAEIKAFAYSAVDAILHNDGYMADENGVESQVSLADMIRKEDLLPLIPQAISHFMMDEIEPMSVIYDSFFTELRMTDVQQSLIVHNIGPLTVQPLGEYGEYPETNLAIDQDGQEINLRLQRYGIELRLHEDVVSRNLLPIVSMWMNRARNAFVRNREQLAIKELQKTGVVVFDNNNPASYTTHEVKSYTGRDITGAYNGTMSYNDLMEMYVKALLDGFTLDTIAMHPFAWQTFMVDPEFKEIIINNNTVVSYRAPDGKGALNRFNQMQFGNLGLPWGKGAGNPELNPSLAKLGQNPYSLQQSVLGSEYFIGPKYFPTPLKIVVSPFIPFRKIGTTTVTDIIFAQSGEAGIVLREGDTMVKSFNVEEKEAVVTRMREGLAYGTMNLGKAVRIAKNVVIDRNYVFNNVNNAQLNYDGAANQAAAQAEPRGPF